MKPRLSDPPLPAEGLPRPLPPLRSSEFRPLSSGPQRAEPTFWLSDRRFLAPTPTMKFWPFGR
jgi:hypothetical protein